ncbi:hypothetical protein RND71_002745 [Anisodus tanguticus]|uniref:Adenylate isopentenyltransferase n=1 Tax=Anisodus tanguticus TaxID=243964 RepID=A0AAE1VW70_9SOLA|nr:hypothetical protein RND71_002745 [Anisodus tanguticus]
MGATGSGKSKLSIDLATRYFPSEIINSDKIQVPKGLDITTNKISKPEQNGVVHHLLGESEYSFSDFTSTDFRFEGDKIITNIINRHKLPLIVGGSNSFIYALLSNRFNPGLDVFENPAQLISNELRFNCCFIWVDVKTPVLNQYLFKRVDEMIKTGMCEELEDFFKENGYSGSGSDSGRVAGLRKAIGVPEMEGYFRKKKSYEEAVSEIKENTRLLAEKQRWKIKQLREAGWDIQRVDATEAFKAAMMTPLLPENGQNQARVIWERDVVIPSMKIVKHFLLE